MMPYSKAPKIGSAVTHEQRTGIVGLALDATLARWLHVPYQQTRRVSIQCRLRCCPDREMLLSLIYSPCAGGVCLSDVDSLERNRVAQRITALKRLPDSSRLGEDLVPMSTLPLVCLRKARLSVLNWEMAVPLPIRLRPVFVDGTSPEGRCCE